MSLLIAFQITCIKTSRSKLSLTHGRPFFPAQLPAHFWANLKKKRTLFYPFLENEQMSDALMRSDCKKYIHGLMEGDGGSGKPRAWLSGEQCPKPERELKGVRF